ncbi:MAG: hypothetical protein ACNA78_06325 [Balneolaceae bacterium]
MTTCSSSRNRSLAPAIKQTLFYFGLMGALALFLLQCGAGEDRLERLAGGADSLIVLDIQSPAFQLMATRDLTYRDSLFQDEITAAVVAPGGHLYQAGRAFDRHLIYRFNPRGVVTDSLTGAGDSPFGLITHLRITGNRLYVAADEIYTFTLTDNGPVPAQNPAFSAPTPDSLRDEDARYAPVPITVTDRGSLFYKLQKERNPVYDLSGEVRFMLAEPNEAEPARELNRLPDVRHLVGDYAGRPAPFLLSVSERPLYSMAGNGFLVTAYSTDAVIQVTRPNGHKPRAYIADPERVPLHPDEVVFPSYLHNDQLHRVRTSATYPAHWPLLTGLLLDDEQRIWVTLFRGVDQPAEWWVIDDRSSRLLAVQPMPQSARLLHVNNSFFYTAEPNDAGFEEVVRYRFRFDRNETTP